MRELEPLLLYQALGPEFYHLKEQIKAMKQSDIDPEKMRSLINGHSIQTSKPPASANLSKKRKADEGQPGGQSGGQTGQSGKSGQSNKRRRSNRGKPTAEKNSGVTTKKCNFCDKPGHLEKDCWEKDPSKRPPPRASQPKANPTTGDKSCIAI